MFKLLKGGHCFSPQDMGVKDVLIAYERICRIEENIEVEGLWDVEVIDCSGKLVWPGFIDQHIHITGGGGEEGPVSRIPELMATDIVKAGVSTVVGVLGIDSVTRSIANLLAKARSLQAEGITSYIYTGSYSIPTATVTGHVLSDIVLIDKVVGVGEVAISDYRSSHPTLQQLQALANEARVGGLVGGKAGIMHMHVGDGKEGLSPLVELVEASNFPIDMFVPTHLNRNRKLFNQATEYARKGGRIDLTAGEKTDLGYCISDALELLLKNGINMERVTVSSDGNGSMPGSDGNNNAVGTISQLFNDIKTSIQGKGLDPEAVLSTVTVNVAKILHLYPKKGALLRGSDADIIVVNQDDFSIDTMVVNGEIFIKNKSVIKKGRYEK